MQTISARIAVVQKKVLPAKLLVVTKGRSKAELQDVLKSGVNMIGENRLQEIQEKYDLPMFHEMKRRGVELHFIGHLQKNKVKKIVNLCDVIESVDSLDLAQHINSAATALKKIMPIFLELSLTGEAQKYGFTESEFTEHVGEIQRLPGLKLRGLMTMGKEGDDILTRSVFRQCKSLANTFGLSEVSIGMSDDYLMALEEGSTMVRLGRVIFATST